jgi:predicted RNA-binding protein
MTLRELTATSFEKAMDLWNHPDVTNFFFGESLKFEAGSDTAIFLPCSKKKPYSTSPTHKHGYLEMVAPYRDEVDLLVVSEPMGIVPYCLHKSYPANAYEYDPYKFFIGKLSNPLARTARLIFIHRVHLWLEKYQESYSQWITILPSWHSSIFYGAAGGLAHGPVIFEIHLTGRPTSHLVQRRVKKDLKAVFSNHLPTPRVKTWERKP